MTWTATIVGKPVTKKNSGRIVGGGKRLLPSAAYMRWESAAIPQLRVARAGRAPINGDVSVRATFYRKLKTTAPGDLINYMQALADALQKAGVLVDDKQIVEWGGCRLATDKGHPRVELVIESVDLFSGAGVQHPFEEKE